MKYGVPGTYEGPTGTSSTIPPEACPSALAPTVRTYCCGPSVLIVVPLGNVRETVPFHDSSVKLLLTYTISTPVCALKGSMTMNPELPTVNPSAPFGTMLPSGEMSSK